jgi:serine/threonine-protein kinase
MPDTSSRTASESYDRPPGAIHTEPSETPPAGAPAQADAPATSPEAAYQTDSPEEAVEEDVESAAAGDYQNDQGEDLYEARMPAKFEGIAKPSEEFESVDSYPSNSAFDSVRIIENGPPGRPDDAETRIHPSQLHPIEPTPVPPVKREEVSIADEVRASTAHNIGMGETDGKRGSKLKPLSEGTLLNGRYEIVRKIGGGGMGAVYLASDNNLGGVLRAVKEMVQAHMEDDQQEKAINDFKRESMILSSLDHVSIPTIYDYFYDEKESRFYLVMKYISGGDLSSRLRSAPEGRIDEKSVTEWAIQIIDVLDYLHNQPSTIVYRDLKPSNIMVDGNSGRAMLIDFGIARSINKKEEKGVTAVGTMGYAPPELFSGNVEPRSDIYSLGSTMFHLLTGADPQSNPLLIFDFQKNPRPRQINPQLSDQMETIIMRAVEYNADARFKSAAEMRQVLEAHLEKLKSGKLSYGVTEIPASVSLANQSVFCGFCGQRIVATDLFCAFCGAKQPIAQQGVHSEIYSQGAWTAKLVIEGTSELAAPAFSLQKDDNLLGRRDPMSNIFPEVDLSKYDPQTKISRRHARIWRDGNNFMVEDLGSSNGTILARSTNESFRLIPKQPQVLTAGDKIRVGDATLHFVIG